MKMKKFLNDPNTLTDELLQGYALAASDLIDVEGHLVISKTLKDADRVTIVTLGGSGHEPAQAGFVGDGMIDIQVVGDVFAAPSPQSVFEAVKMADKGHGVLLLVLNHAGDMLCANMVMKMAERAAITVRKVITQEDIPMHRVRMQQTEEVWQEQSRFTILLQQLQKKEKLWMR